jgi:hypothetical protein
MRDATAAVPFEDGVASLAYAPDRTTRRRGAGSIAD